MKRQTCKINADRCILKHLCLDTCSDKAIVLPCEEMTDDEMEELKNNIEDFRTENKIDY